MFDFAWSEIALIAVVALVVIGPKDLPRVMRSVGFWVGRARSIAREFQSSLDQMIRESELEDVRKQVEEATKLDLPNTIEKAVDPTGDLQRSLAEPLVSTPSVGEASAPAESVAPARPAAETPALPAPETPAAEPAPSTADAAEPRPAKSGTHD